MGDDPTENMPVELEDFPEDIIMVHNIYSRLPDIFEPMAGTYQGKNITTLSMLLKSYDIVGDDVIWFIDVFNMFETSRTEVIRNKKAMEDAKNKVKPPSL